MDSIKKNTVAATIAIEMIQKEIATGSLGFRKPFKSAGAASAAEAETTERQTASVESADILWIFKRKAKKTSKWCGE
jgi:hypothetical protein